MTLDSVKKKVKQAKQAKALADALMRKFTDIPGMKDTSSLRTFKALGTIIDVLQKAK